MPKNTKENLLLAAVSEFAAHGYQATTVRSIVKRAGEKNLNSIVYYFGSKEELYKATLDFMFREAEKFREDIPDSLQKSFDAKTKLEMMIRFLCRAYYSIQNDLDRALYQLFIKEAGNPSPYFEEMVERHLKPPREFLCSLLREHLGPNISQQTIDDCEYSISGQILYGVLGRSLINKINPSHAPFEKYFEELAEHVVKFTMAGLEAYRGE
ncbi:TetR/AcrR family transcriptional regulator [Desulfovibrio inopinatus]|uniref:TetR/AcrR family transcriptional regulator n=1 Tax=Desulfovibrio inopinatus TaxID=102109 RepID=UPI0003F77600|nr:CerR family C-terminal domain-containing protein [Desulfovibrio inopinatus]